MSFFDNFKNAFGRRRSIFSNTKIQLILIAYPFFFSLAYFVGLILVFTVLDFFNCPFFLSPEGGFQVNISFYVLLSFVVILTVAVVIAGFVITNRITGPLYRLTCHMRNITEHKNLNDISFRKNDFFQELSSEFNQMMEQLRPNISANFIGKDSSTKSTEVD